MKYFSQIKENFILLNPFDNLYKRSINKLPIILNAVDVVKVMESFM